MNPSPAAVFKASAPLWAATQPGEADVHVGKIRAFDTSAWLFYRCHASEWARRADAGAGALESLAVLDFLMELPEGLPVPISGLPTRDRLMLRQVPPTAVHVANGFATRLFAPAVTPLLAVVQARDWSDGLESASRFAPYCSRAVLVRDLPEGESAALFDASFYGIGVFASDGRDARMVVRPEELPDWQPTPAWWLFCERMYRQLSATTAT